jgi:hypothetical protein
LLVLIGAWIYWVGKRRAAREAVQS